MEYYLIARTKVKDEWLGTITLSNSPEEWVDYQTEFLKIPIHLYEDFVPYALPSVIPQSLVDRFSEEYGLLKYAEYKLSDTCTDQLLHIAEMIKDIYLRAAGREIVWMLT